MKNVYSNIYTFNKKILKKTIKYLNEGSIIGLPTETVYGIAANAYSQKAVVKIFKLKGRPKKNPLIIHYHNINDLKDDVILNKNFTKLYKKFCPGPITFILKKNRNSKVCTRATANLNTVAIRFPSHKVVRAILNYINFPIAMPSANLSSALSPITAYDVFEDFKDKLKLIVNGGKSKIGIESTVIDLSGKPKILRPGIIGANEIRNAIKLDLSKKRSKLRSPGMLKKHYSPGIPVIMNKKSFNPEHAQIVIGKKYKIKKNYFNLSKKGDLKEAASNLYMTMRKIKKLGYKKIFVTTVPNFGPGIAINDRLKRASK